MVSVHPLEQYLRSLGATLLRLLNSSLRNEVKDMHGLVLIIELEHLDKRRKMMQHWSGLLR